MANYYNEKVINKFNEALKAAREEIRSGKINAVSISAKNIKMGAVASVSLLPFITCPGTCKGTCGKDCYAAKIANMRTSVLKSYARNTALLLEKPALYWAGVKYAVAGSRFFRFHVSGDIANAEYFKNMIETAKENPHCEILVFTKKYAVVNAWISENGDLPKNLHILFSGWTNLKPENPHNLPETNIFDTENPPAENWNICGGNCFECGCRGTGCWKSEKGETIAFKKH